MAELYRSHEVRPSTEGVPIVIHCSDPRFQPHFQDFLSQALQLDHYALIAVPGGPQMLAMLDYLPKFSWAGWRWMKFMTDLTKAERVVLIVHDECRWYLQQLLGSDPTRMQQKMYEDARRVRAALGERFGVNRVEVYHAKLVGSRAVFDAVS